MQSAVAYLPPYGGLGIIFFLFLVVVWFAADWAIFKSLKRMIHWIEKSIKVRGD